MSSIRKTIEGIIFEMEALNSKDISYLGHDAASGTLAIEFTRGPVYVFNEVPREVYEQLCTAEAPDALFADKIKNGYRNKRVG